METDWQEKATENGKVYVKFGPNSTQEMPREWAEKMLALWCERHPAQFGKLLSEVATGLR